MLKDLREPETKVFYQTYTKDGWILEKSHSLKEGTFGLDETVRHDLKIFKEKFDDVTLPSGLQVRRVTLYLTVPRFSFSYAPGTNAPSQSIPYSIRKFMPKGWKGPPPDARQHPKESLKYFIQYASDVKKRDQDILALDDKLEQDKARLNEVSLAALEDVRRRVLWVGLGTFAGLVLGGYLLVWVGLVPLKRLSDAVAGSPPAISAWRSTTPKCRTNSSRSSNA